MGGRMNDKTTMIIAGVFALSFSALLLFIGMQVAESNKNMVLVQSDLNVLKSNDLGFAQYIIQNSQTLDYLNKNCRVTSDTNEITILTCLKVKE
jgi:hypothetical protein